MRDVALWDAADVTWDVEELERSYVTDVFHRSARPKRGALVLGIESQSAGGSVVTVLAVARSLQAVATQKDRVRMDPVVRLTQSVSLEEVGARLEEGHRRRLEQAGRPGPLRAVELSPQLSAAVANALRSASPEAAGLIDAWDQARSQRFEGSAGYRLREERDAIQLGVDLAAVEPPEEMVRHVSSIPTRGQLALTSAFDEYFMSTDIEDELIAEDLRRFDPRGTLELRSPAVARFEDDNFALTIVNVNRKPLEKVLGVDLVYWDEVGHVFTLVQYKRLVPHTWDESSMRRTWAFTRRSEVEVQLGRMNLGRPRLTGSADWRLAASPFWFKFVKADDFVAGDPWVLRGMYVPADFLRAALKEDGLRDGPRRGFAITYENAKYVTRDTFVELIRRGLVGTTRSGTRRVLDIIAELAAVDEVVVAVKAPATRRSHPTFGRSILGEAPF